MSNDILELIAPFALDAVEDDERRAVEGALEADPALRAEAAMSLQVAAALGEGLADEGAPGRLWSRVAAELDPSPVAEVIPLRRRRWSTAVAAAAAAAFVAVLGIQVWLQHSEIEDLRSAPFAAAVEEAREAGALEVAMTGDVSAGIVLAGDGVGYLLGEDLPALSEDLTYQLWAVVGDAVVSVGVVGADPEISPFTVDGEVALFALTVETAGGVVASEQDPVAVADLGA